MHAPSLNGEVEKGTGQKALMALDLIRQGWKVDDARARVGVGNRAIQKARLTLNRRPDLWEPMWTGELSLNAAQLEAGFLVKTSDKALGINFGKGDKWYEATEGMIRYLEAWQTREFKFAHLNPRESAKRLERLTYIQELIEKAKPDLEARAVRAQLSAPSK